MPLLSAVILAQVVTAGIGDRVEARGVVQPSDERMEAENLAYASAGLTFPFLSLNLTYSPSLVVTPVERTPRVFALTHTLRGESSSTVTMVETARFVMTARVGATYLQQDFRRQLLGAPVPRSAGATEPDPNLATRLSDVSQSEAVRANGLTMRSGNANGDFSFTEKLSARSTLAETVGYDASSGFDRVSRRLYPFTHGPFAGLAFTERVTGRDTLTTSASGQLVFLPATSERAWNAGLSQGYVHLFNRRTSADASVGVVYARSEEPGAEPLVTISPAAQAGLRHENALSRGRLSLRLELSYAPVLDRTALVYDSRIGVLGSAEWKRDPWLLYASTTTTFSPTIEDEGSLSAAAGTAGGQYDLGAGFGIDAGTRLAWQNYEGTEFVPLTWVGFVAVFWNYGLL